MKIIIGTRRPECPQNRNAIGSAESGVRNARTRRYRLSFSFLLSAVLHGVFVALLVATAWLFEPTPPWRPPFATRVMIIRLSKPVYLPGMEQRAARPVIGSDAGIKIGKPATSLGVSHLDASAMRKIPTPGVAAASPTLIANRVLIEAQSAPDVQPAPASQAVPSAIVWPDRLPIDRKNFQVPPGPAVDMRAIEMHQPALDLPMNPGGRLTRVDLPLVIAAGTTMAQSLLPFPPANALGGEQAAPKAMPPMPELGIGEALRKLAIFNPPIATLDDPSRGSKSETPQFLSGSRIDHPSNGRFDVVVLQTTLEDILPETAGLMKDKPVYSVYLQVGDTKEWILHYCAAGGEVTQRGAVIQLPDPRPLSAPYPSITFRPAAPVSGGGSYVLISGIVDETGVFRNLRVINQTQTDLPSLLSALERWRFRPASRGASRAPVEIVLAIPVSKT